VDWSLRELGKNGVLLSLPKPPFGNFRCRVLYFDKIEKVEFLPIVERKFETFALLNSDIEYRFKFENRAELEKEKSRNLKESDDVIFVKNSLLRDTSIANIYFKRDDIWVTPKQPLLKGTVRERVLRENLVVEKDISVDEVSTFQKMAISNALIGFKEIKDWKIV
jgi:4-amino-4-deoxychorismate lyase